MFGNGGCVGNGYCKHLLLLDAVVGAGGVPAPVAQPEETGEGEAIVFPLLHVAVVFAPVCRLDRVDELLTDGDMDGLLYGDIDA